MSIFNFLKFFLFLSLSNCFFVKCEDSFLDNNDWKIDKDGFIDNDYYKKLLKKLI